MSLKEIIIYAVIQGLAELLPVSSSAHVIAAAKLLKRDPTTPQFVSLLVMLHTGTMFAVIVYFWRSWKRTFFQSQDQFLRFATKIIIATGVTGALGLGLLKGIEHYMDPGYTRLESWSISEYGRSVKHPPTPLTLLTQLVATDAPEIKLFNVGDTMTVNAKKGAEVIPYSGGFTVTPTSTLKDLFKFLQSACHIDPWVPAGRKNIPAPGVMLTADDNPKHPNAVRIIITGNEGSENHIKFVESGFADQNGQTRIGFLDTSKGEVEKLFKHMDLMAGALAAAGVLILIAGIVTAFQRHPPRKGITTADGFWIGMIQGMTLPFRGFSRSGATISLGLLRGIARQRAEEFSFALAVVLTPPVLAYETYRLLEHVKQSTPIPIGSANFMPGLKGMAFSFIAGLVALKLLSKLLEKGQWWLFGVYCLVAASGIWWMHTHGYGA